MPDPNNPLEVAIRRIRAMIPDVTQETTVEIRKTLVWFLEDAIEGQWKAVELSGGGTIRKQGGDPGGGL